MDYFLLIEPETTSLSSNLFLVFKPKELLQGEPFSLKLYITNKGGSHFPGGKLTNITLTHGKENINDPIEEKTISSLAKDESCTIDLDTWHPFGVGNMRIECRVKLDSGEAVKCYQKLKASKKLFLIQNTGMWEDFISVSHKSEIHQRYTNNILIALTAITIIYYLATVFFDFPV